MADQLEVTVQKGDDETVSLSEAVNDKEFGEEGGPESPGGKLEAEAGTEDTDKKVEESKELPKEEESKEEDPRDAEIRALRVLTREQRKELNDVSEKLAKNTKVLEEANLITEEEKEAAKANQELYNKRIAELENIQELMRLNPKYEDVDAVCSQERWDDMVEMMATALVKADPKEGTIAQVTAKLESELWTLTNPYRYMYDQIKKYHPDFVKTTVESTGTDNSDKSKLEAAKKAIGKEKGGGTVSGPGSVHDIPGGESSANVGWTTARIDAMDEYELAKVPPDIYDKYLKNQLR